MRKRYLAFSVFVIVILVLMTVAEAYQIADNVNTRDDKKLLANVDNVKSGDDANKVNKVDNNEEGLLANVDNVNVMGGDDIEDGREVGDSNNDERGLFDNIVNDFKSWTGFFNSIFVFGKNKVSGYASYGGVELPTYSNREFPAAFLGDVYYRYLKSSKARRPDNPLFNIYQGSFWWQRVGSPRQYEKLLASDPSTTLGLPEDYVFSRLKKESMLGSEGYDQYPLLLDYATKGDSLIANFFIFYYYYTYNRLKERQINDLMAYYSSAILLRSLNSGRIFDDEVFNSFRNNPRALPVVLNLFGNLERGVSGDNSNFNDFLDKIQRAIEKRALFYSLIYYGLDLRERIKIIAESDLNGALVGDNLDIWNFKFFSQADQLSPWSRLGSYYINLPTGDEKFTIEKLYQKYYVDRSLWSKDYIDFDLALNGRTYEGALVYLEGRISKYRAEIDFIERDAPIIKLSQFDGSDTKNKLISYLTNMKNTALNDFKQSQKFVDNLASRFTRYDGLDMGAGFEDFIASSPAMPRFSLDERDPSYRNDLPLDIIKSANRYIALLDNANVFRLDQSRIDKIWKDAYQQMAVVALAVPAIIVAPSMLVSMRAAALAAYGANGIVYAIPGTAALLFHIGNVLMLGASAYSIGKTCIEYGSGRAIFDLERVGNCMQIVSMASIGIIAGARSLIEMKNKIKSIDPATSQTLDADAESHRVQGLLENIIHDLETELPRQIERVRNEQRTSVLRSIDDVFDRKISNERLTMTEFNDAISDRALKLRKFYLETRSDRAVELRRYIEQKVYSENKLIGSDSRNPEFYSDPAFIFDLKPGWEYIDYAIRQNPNARFVALYRDAVPFKVIYEIKTGKLAGGIYPARNTIPDLMLDLEKIFEDLLVGQYAVRHGRPTFELAYRIIETELNEQLSHSVNARVILETSIKDIKRDILWLRVHIVSSLLEEGILESVQTAEGKYLLKVKGGDSLLFMETAYRGTANLAVEYALKGMPDEIILNGKTYIGLNSLRTKHLLFKSTFVRDIGYPNAEQNPTFAVRLEGLANGFIGGHPGDVALSVGADTPLLGFLMKGEGVYRNPQDKIDISFMASILRERENF